MKCLSLHLFWGLGFILGGLEDAAFSFCVLRVGPAMVKKTLENVIKLQNWHNSTIMSW
jgi:hypothetical protein